MKQIKKWCEIRNTKQKSNKCTNCIFFRTKKIENGQITKWKCNRIDEFIASTETYLQHLTFVIKQESEETTQKVLKTVQNETEQLAKSVPLQS